MKGIKHDKLLIKGLDQEYFNVKIGKSSIVDLTHNKFINVNTKKYIEIAIKDWANILIFFNLNRLMLSLKMKKVIYNNKFIN